MAPWSDSHGVALNCLLLSTALLEACALQRRDLAQHYAQTFRYGAGDDPRSDGRTDGRDAT